MPRRKGPRSELMIEAASRGGELAQRASEEVVRERQEAAAQIERGAQQVAGMFFESEQREKERGFQGEQATLDRANRAELAAQEAGSRERTAAAERAQQQSQYEEQRDIELADKGLIDRQKKLDGDMERGRAQTQGYGPSPQEAEEALRLQKNMAQPVEMYGGDNRFAQSPERVAQDQQRLDTAQMRAQTAAQNAAIRESRHRQEMGRARYAGDQEKWKLERQAATESIKDVGQLVEDGINGKIDSQSDWSGIKALLEGHADGEVQSAIESKTWNQSVKRALSNLQATKVLQYMAETGDFPDSSIHGKDIVDEINPMMVRFKQTQVAAGQMFSMLDVAPFMRISSLMDKNVLTRKAAANVILLEEQMRAQSVQSRQQPRVSRSAEPQRQPGLKETGGYGLR